ncbi:hypothetical protein AMV165 [Betaentomopoxvirus amoorei]|uniref:AMV165 n=1 Tax=Amsacta moorei entomopoxvirus TaxID=28321 RepID=Q9EMN4_AMEPV|nr:hypothetical protein AMV165 [Amsacta moorei entomopoxvirus]AAG02871.1 AMV165 [Amsacta moorei entomopoxvirus]
MDDIYGINTNSIVNKNPITNAIVNHDTNNVTNTNKTKNNNDIIIKTPISNSKNNKPKPKSKYKIEKDTLSPLIEKDEKSTVVMEIDKITFSDVFRQKKDIIDVDKPKHNDLNKIEMSNVNSTNADIKTEVNIDTKTETIIDTNTNTNTNTYTYKNTQNRKLPPTPDQDLIYKKKITKFYNNYDFMITICMFIINCIILPLIVISDACESFKIDYINSLICGTYLVYTILSIIIILKRKPRCIIRKIIIICIISIQLFIIILSSMVFSIEIFDTNERCSKILTTVIILIVIINLIWSFVKNIIIIINTLFNYNILHMKQNVCDYIV